MMVDAPRPNLPNVTLTPEKAVDFLAVVYDTAALREEEHAAFMGFVDGISMALHHPEWAAAFFSGLPIEARAVTRGTANEMVNKVRIELAAA